MLRLRRSSLCRGAGPRQRSPGYAGAQRGLALAVPGRGNPPTALYKFLGLFWVIPRPSPPGTFRRSHSPWHGLCWLTAAGASPPVKPEEFYRSAGTRRARAPLCCGVLRLGAGDVLAPERFCRESSEELCRRSTAEN